MDLREFLSRTSELRHPWEISRRRFFEHQLRLLDLKEQAVTALDVGSGDTWLARRLYKVLPNGSWMTCVDEFYTTDVMAKFNPRVPVELTSVLPDRQYDLILMLDVLEHVQDDKEFLRNVLKHAKAESKVLISVPAFRFLFGKHDRGLFHFRRYSRRDLRGLLDSCGLEIERQGGLFHSLLYVRMVQRLLECFTSTERQQAGVKDWQGGPVVTRLLSWALDFDWQLGLMLGRLGVRLPGLSWWCVCQKR
ncbi:MAG: methyltransferase domain-containing protein [Bdellovibrionales bacterium]|nr:methyltransferase domain-containing protein [Bdellovibrionales bacterium]